MAGGPVLLALSVAVLAGLVSFASPCVVPLVPGYLSYLAAVVGVEDGWSNRGGDGRTQGAVAGGGRGGVVRRWVHRGVPARHRRGAGHGDLVDRQSVVLQRIGGVITIVMGLVFVGYVPALQRRYPVRAASVVDARPVRHCSARCSRLAGRRAWARR